ncbi:MAG TPA: serine protease [Longimicrobium sp.]|jgi:S1-C subfamily serine protease
MTYSLDWKATSNQPLFDIGAMIGHWAINIVSQEFPELVDLFPFRNSYDAQVHAGPGWLGFIADFSQVPGVPRVGYHVTPETRVLEQASRVVLTGTHEDLRAVLPHEYFSFSRFTYVGPYQDGALSSEHLLAHFVGWINDCVIPVVFQMNQTRVLRAIPQPPTVDLGKIANSLWVLECEESIRQGTAFMLEGVGLVTCDHVLGPCTKAFRPSAYHDKRSVTVEMTEPAIDLAVLQIDGEFSGVLEAGSADHLDLMDHLVVCGFPNYRVGDTGTIVPGLVVGFRTISGIRRILTNAPIIGGVSGGPVLDADGKVIGIAATGADRMENAQDTEHHSIVPVDAIALLRKKG